MSSMIIRNSELIALPAPRVPVSIRVATMDDLPFVDALQKQHAKMVGWMPKSQLREKIGKGQCLIAEGIEEEKRSGGEEETSGHSSPLLLDSSTPLLRPLGYVIGQDRYFKRDDVGIIYALNVVPGHQRSLIGANLLRAMFDRAAYGCRLFCCWCAQDIAANRFWEAMGFVSLAFRAGSAKKARVHIFWQKRVRAGDGTTPYWFPSETKGGSIREDRLVFPIPPGTHWSDAKPIILPGMERREEPKLRASPPSAGSREKERLPAAGLPTAGAPSKPRLSGWSFAPPATPAAADVAKPKPKPPRKAKNDPRLVAAARELRDRWLERVNAMPMLSCGKYDVTRAVDTAVVAEPLFLPAA
jgi:GNAT superfamily N-acetyltransferase